MNAKFFLVLIATLIIALAACFYTITSVKKALSQNEPRPNNSGVPLDLLDSRLSKLELKINRFQAAIDKISAGQTELTQLAKSFKKDASDGTLNDYLLSVNEALYKLEDLIQASGLQAIATNDVVDSSVLGDMYEQQVEIKQFKKYQEAMTLVAQKQKDSDLELYGEEISELNKSMWFGRDDEKRKANLDELLTKYPDSYAAGNALAMAAFAASYMENDATKAQEFYQQMQDNDKYMQAINPQMKVKLAPNVQYKLAQDYVSAGQYEDAETILEQMQSFQDDHIFGGMSGMQSVPKAIKDLRQKIKDNQ